MSFLDDIKAFRDKALSQASTNANTVTEEFFTKVVTISPAKPAAQFAVGHLKDNYYTAINGYDMSTSGSVSMSGASSIARIKATLAQNPFLAKDAMVSMSNNVGYAYRADKLGWMPKGKGTNGWYWSGRTGPYLMTSLAVSYTLGVFS
jgi:hypothetical protein